MAVEIVNIVRRQQIQNSDWILGMRAKGLQTLMRNPYYV